MNHIGIGLLVLVSIALVSSGIFDPITVLCMIAGAHTGRGLAQLFDKR